MSEQKIYQPVTKWGKRQIDLGFPTNDIYYAVDQYEILQRRLNQLAEIESGDEGLKMSEMADNLTIKTFRLEID